MTTKVMVYVYDHIKYPAQIKFAVVGHEGMGTGRFDDEAENMLVNLFNDEATKWHLNSDWEDEAASEAFDDYGKVDL